MKTIPLQPLMRSPIDIRSSKGLDASAKISAMLVAQMNKRNQVTQPPKEQNENI